MVFLSGYENLKLKFWWKGWNSYNFIWVIFVIVYFVDFRRGISFINYFIVCVGEDMIRNMVYVNCNFWCVIVEFVICYSYKCFFKYRVDFWRDVSYF